MDRVMIRGQVGKEVRLRTTFGGKIKGTFPVCVDSPEGPKSIWCVVWENMAKRCAAHLKAGSMVIVGGPVRVRSYDRGLVIVSVTEIMADTVKLLKPKGAVECG